MKKLLLLCLIPLLNWTNSQAAVSYPGQGGGGGGTNGGAFILKGYGSIISTQVNGQTYTINLDPTTVVTITNGIAIFSNAYIATLNVDNLVSSNNISIFGATILDPITAPDVTGMNALVTNVVGNLSGDPGGFVYRVAFLTTNGLTEPSHNATNNFDGLSNQKILLTGIPTSSSPKVTQRYIYRQAIADSTYRFVGALSNNTATTFVDNVAEGSLGTNNSPWNLTGGYLIINGYSVPIWRTNWNSGYIDLLSSEGRTLQSWRPGVAMYVGMEQSKDDPGYGGWGFGDNAISIQVPNPDTSTNEFQPRISLQFSETYGWRFWATNFVAEQKGTGAAGGRPEYIVFGNDGNGGLWFGNTNNFTDIRGSNIVFRIDTNLNEVARITRDSNFTFQSTITIKGGSPGAGKVWTSADSSGNGNWQTPSGGGGGISQALAGWGTNASGIGGKAGVTNNVGDVFIGSATASQTTHLQLTNFAGSPSSSIDFASDGSWTAHQLSGNVGLDSSGNLNMAGYKLGTVQYIDGAGDLAVPVGAGLIVGTSDVNKAVPAMIEVTNNGVATLITSNNVTSGTFTATSGSGSNYLGADTYVAGKLSVTGGSAYATNQNQIKPDFTVSAQLMSTNAAFTFLAPVGVDTTKLTMQTTAIYVTNTTAAAVLVTAPANCHPVPATGMYVTNLTRFTFEVYAQKFTNCFAVPVF